MLEYLDLTDRNFEEGKIVLVDKPLEWTSFDIVRKVRNTLKHFKVGHAGTLDPLATGLLILCIGKMTKRIHELQDMEKEYTGEMIIGKTTPSCDMETDFDTHTDISGITNEKILEVAEQFKGKIMQVPPIYSAVKVEGERLYKKARRGEDVQIVAKEIEIHDFEITEISLPVIKFRVTCSKGTYIRSLARDFGVALETGACLSALRRTRIGNYTIDNAYDIQDLIQLLKIKK